MVAVLFSNNRINWMKSPSPCCQYGKLCNFLQSSFLPSCEVTRQFHLKIGSVKWMSWWVPGLAQILAFLLSGFNTKNWSLEFKCKQKRYTYIWIGVFKVQMQGRWQVNGPLPRPLHVPQLLLGKCCHVVDWCQAGCRSGGSCGHWWVTPGVDTWGLSMQNS